jgi:hypothetical protein
MFDFAQRQTWSSLGTGPPALNDVDGDSGSEEGKPNPWLAFPQQARPDDFSVLAR